MSPQAKGIRTMDTPLARQPVRRAEPDNDRHRQDAPRRHIDASSLDSWSVALEDIREAQVHSDYRELKKDLELGTGADAYGEVLHAADAATANYHKATILHQRVKMDVERELARIDAQIQTHVAEGRRAFAAQLAKNASDERVLALLQTDESKHVVIDDLQRQRREVEAGRRVFEGLEEAWKMRCRHLDTMLARAGR